MKIKDNFQIHFILTLLLIFNNLCLAIPLFILKFYYNVPFFITLLIFLLLCLYNKFFYMDYSKKIFEKYCNKECKNCIIWHCDYHYEDSKYIK